MVLHALEPEASRRYHRRALSALHDVPVESTTVSPITLGLYVGLPVGAVEEELPPIGGASEGCKVDEEVPAVETSPPLVISLLLVADVVLPPDEGAMVEEPPVEGRAGLLLL